MDPKPTHLRDFPFERVDDALVTRREYLRLLTLTSLGLFLGTASVALASLLRRDRTGEAVRVASVGDVPEGSALNFNYPGEDDPAILVHLRGDRFVAFSQKCTHLACAVYYDRKSGRLLCPCHDGAFDAETGLVIAGPPPRPLPRIELRVENGEIHAVREVQT